MLPGQARLIRFVMLGVVIAVVVSVALNFRHPPPPLGPDRSASTESHSGPSKERSITDYEVRPLKSGQDVVLRAKKMTSRGEDNIQLEGVTLHFPYKAQGKEGIAEITSNECLYNPREERALFKGAVRLRTPEGFGLDADALSYDGPRQLAQTDTPFTFREGQTSGGGTGFIYDGHTGVLKVLANARLHEDNDQGGSEIRSQKATIDRGLQTALFEGDVEATQVQDVLNTTDLLVNFDEKSRAMTRAQALHGARVRMLGPQTALGPADRNAGSGERVMQGQKFDIWFGANRKLDKVINYGGDVIVHPGPKDSPEIKRLAADVLQFDFDAEGRLMDVVGLKNAQMTIDPVDGSTDPRRHRLMTCRHFKADFAADSGQMKQAEFSKDVVFTSGARRATAGEALFQSDRAPGGLVTLTENPQIEDSDQGSRLSAVTIEIAPESGNIAAHNQVRHVLSARKAGSKDTRAPEVETVATCREFRYESAHREAVYQHEALIRSGDDELRAAAVRIVGPDGARHLYADGDVVTLVSPRGKDKTQGPIDARARRMVYDEAARNIQYDGDVIMRQRDLVSHSPKSTVYLTGDAKDIDHVDAGEPVRIEQGTRTATGARGVYRASNRTFTLTGPDVTVRDAGGQSTRGRSLTFVMGDDTIQVDGREEVRTETVFRADRPLP